MAAEALSANSFPTLAMNFPFLRAIRGELEKTTLYDHEISLLGEQPFVDITVKLVQGVRETMLTLFRQRFAGMKVDVMWISFLDPRLTEMAHLTATESLLARNCCVRQL